MLVKDLVRMLQAFDQNLEIMVNGYEGGVDYPCDPFIVNIKRDANVVNEECPYYYGRHEIDMDAIDRVVYLARK